jgi:uncharacterized protein
MGALLAPPLYWGAQGVAAHVHSAGLSDFLAKTDFARYFDRAMTISALVLLWPLLAALRIRNFSSDLGLQRDRRGLRRLIAGFFVAMIPLALLAGVLVWTGVYRMHSQIPWGKIAWVPVTAFVVAGLEEFLFRGAIQGAVRKTTIDDFAFWSVAILFAIVHFLKPPDHGLEASGVHWWSGLALLPDTLSQFGQPGLLLGGFTTLLVVGLILGYARMRTRSLWMPIGLHAGWVLGKLSFEPITRHSEAWPWLGPDLLIGLAPLITLGITWGIVWWMVGRER